MRIATKIDGKICKKTAVNIYTNAVVAYRILSSSTQRTTSGKLHKFMKSTL